MTRRSHKKALIYLVLNDLLRQVIAALTLIIAIVENSGGRKRKLLDRDRTGYSMIPRMYTQNFRMSRSIIETDVDYLVNCHMDRNAFGRFCRLLREVGGLNDGRYISVEEQAAIFLSVLAHHTKNRNIRFEFHRSGQTISHYVNLVLSAVLKLHSHLLVTPESVPEDSNDNRWGCFPGCLGALDGTYVQVQVPVSDKARYRTRKGHIATNVLGVCDRNLRFIYILPGWEGSAADARVLRDALQRSNGFRVPAGNYYLCDAGYANTDSFLAPYRGARYHLKEWGPAALRPQKPREFFNMKHSKARNVVERAFGIMHMRWAIFRSQTFYQIWVQTRLIMAGFLVHNFIHSVMAVDPFEILYDLNSKASKSNHLIGDMEEHESGDEFGLFPLCSNFARFFGGVSCKWDSVQSIHSSCS